MIASQRVVMYPTTQTSRNQLADRHRGWSVFSGRFLMPNSNSGNGTKVRVLGWTARQIAIRDRLAVRAPGEKLIDVAAELSRTPSIGHVSYSYIRQLRKLDDFIEAVNRKAEEEMGKDEPEVRRALVREAVKGNVEAIKYYFKQLGKHPPDEMKVSGIPPAETRIVLQIEELHASLTAEERASVIRGARVLSQAQERALGALETREPRGAG
jgi:hypothetical protein